MKIALLLVVLVTFFAINSSHADEPNIKTPAPVIYLADNLDEKDQLGWCIDTVGRGFGERLHAHSCKPQGGDVQFSFISKTGQVTSVEFKNYCMADRPDGDSVFGLEACNPESAEQAFSYNASSKELSPKSRPEQCVVVGAESDSAGPFLSRKLLLADCSTTDAQFKQWIIKE